MNKNKIKLTKYSSRSLFSYFKKLGGISFDNLDIFKIEECLKLKETKNIDDLKLVLKERIFSGDSNIISWYNKTNVVNIDNYKESSKHHNTSLPWHILRYGEEEGTKIYNGLKKSFAVTLEKCIKKYGKEEGTKRWDSIREAKGNSLEKCIKKYGKEEGTKKWNSICETNSRTVKKEYYIEKYGEEKADEICKAGKNTRLDYYINKGYSLEESKDILSKRQATFSLDKCIEKYGIKEGIEIFNKRQDKWLETLNSKPQEEIDRINKAKMFDKNGNPHTALFFHNNSLKKYKDIKQVNGRLYYVRFYDEDKTFWKIGITTKSIEERFGKSCPFKYDIILDEEMLIYEAYLREQKILSNNYDNRMIIDGFSTECFNRDILEYIKPILSESIDNIESRILNHY
jgi:hypothetical protein